MKTNAAGRKLILEFEGFRMTAYLCSSGTWTIGIGATGRGIGPGVVWTEAQVWKRFEQDLYKFEQQVRAACETPLNENQFSALVSFTFNFGIGRLRRSTLLRRVNEGDFLRAGAEFLRWIDPGSPSEPGLRRRRLAEQALFLTPVERKQVA